MWGWIYAATALLIVLAILVLGPYFGLYGTTDPLNELEEKEGET